MVQKPGQLLARLSAYRRADGRVREKTVHGGVVTLLGCALALTLFFSEAIKCFSVRRVHQMFVDTSRDPTMRMEFDITFPALPCSAVMMDMGDGSGQHHTEASMSKARNGELHKYELSAAGERLHRQEYVAPRDPMADNRNPFSFMLSLDRGSLNDMNEAMLRHDGCNLVGWVELARVAGNVHFSVRPEALFSSMNANEVMAALMSRHLELGGAAHADAARLNASHVIHRLRFGEETYRGQTHPLEGVSRIDRKATGLDRYFIRVVPTRLESGRWAAPRVAAQYAVSEYYTPLSPANRNVFPGILFLYDIHPIAVRIQERTHGLLHFLVRVAAVVGGVFAVTSAADRVVHRTVTALTRRAAPTPTRRHVPSALPIGAILRSAV